MKTYVITLSKEFPKTHDRSGQPTNFRNAFNSAIMCTKCKKSNRAMCMGECIVGYRKIHTIRANYPFWKKRIEEVQNGTACLSIRQWADKPYRSKQVEIARLTAENGVGIQEVYIVQRNGQFATGVTSNDGRVISALPMDTLANNDGLSRNDFQEWFKNADFSKPLAIIHFTKFRY